MKKIVYVIISILCICGIILCSLLFYKKVQEENERIDREAIVLKENVITEYGEIKKVSDYIENINGRIAEDYQINTEFIGEKAIEFNFYNIKNKLRKAIFNLKISDTVAPKIYSGSSYTITVGKEIDLTQVLLSGDNIDDSPDRKIIGEYDVNTVGDYQLTYTVTDYSGNETKKDFILHVIEKNNTQIDNKKEPKYWDDIVEKYKNDKTKIGIDVSKWQGNINWEEVKNSGVEFVIIRMGYQTDYDGELKIDPYFKANIEGVKNVGLPIGLYFYSYAKTVEQAEEQANWVKEQIKDYEISLPIAFDWESWSSFNKTNMSFYKINKVANRFLEVLEQDNYKGLLYGSKNYLEKIWSPTKYPIWLAHYIEKTDYAGNFDIWQMCDTGRINGINGNVDIDIMYEK